MTAHRDLVNHRCFHRNRCSAICHTVSLKGIFQRVLLLLRSKANVFASLFVPGPYSNCVGKRSVTPLVLDWPENKQIFAESVVSVA